MSAVEHVSVEQERVRPVRVPARLKALPLPEKDHAWPKGVFPATVLALLAAGLIGHLVLQTSIQEQGFELADLQSQAEYLSSQQSILQATLDTRSTPQQLAQAASSLGMVANPYVSYIDLASGEVTGVNKPVRGDELPEVSAPAAVPVDPVPIDAAAQAAQDGQNAEAAPAAGDAAPAADPAGGRQ